jgi:RNA-directed DNA polymerase
MTYEEIISIENLYEAARKAVRCKRSKQDIATFLLHLEKNIQSIHQDLQANSYRHSGYEIFEITDPKRRVISKATVRDRVVHHAVHSFVYPLLDKSFITHSYACRNGKGSHNAILQTQTYCRSYSFAIHLDIKQYFASIDRTILKRILQKKIKSKEIQCLLDEIIDSSSNIQIYCEKGLPLGNLTSQLFANVYLNELDKFVKHSLHIKPYIRYMDDMLIFGNDSRELLLFAHQMKDFSADHLALQFHEKCFQILPTAKGIAYLGFRIYPFYKKVLPHGINRFRYRLKRLESDYQNHRIDVEYVSQSIRSSLSFLQFGDTKWIRKKLLNNFKMIRRKKHEKKNFTIHNAANVAIH